MCNNRLPEHSEVRSFRSSVVCQLLVYSNRHLFIGIFAGIQPQQDAARTTRHASVVCWAHLRVDWCWCSDGSQCQPDVDAQPGRNNFSIEASRLSGLCSLLWSGCIANLSPQRCEPLTRVPISGTRTRANSITRPISAGRANCCSVAGEIRDATRPQQAAKTRETRCFDRKIVSAWLGIDVRLAL